MTGSANDDHDRSRRDWLGLCTKAAVGTSAAAVAVPIAHFAVPASPSASAEAPKSLVVCKADELEPGQFRIVMLASKPAVVLRQPAGTLHAFHAACTHLGCTVRFDPDRVRLHCACHGAQFDATTGAVLQGPATRPLSPLAVQVRNDRIVIGS